jgi:hypothetical protein
MRLLRTYVTLPSTKSESGILFKKPSCELVTDVEPCNDSFSGAFDTTSTGNNDWTESNAVLAGLNLGSVPANFPFSSQLSNGLPLKPFPFATSAFSRAQSPGAAQLNWTLFVSNGIGLFVNLISTDGRS